MKEKYQSLPEVLRVNPFSVPDGYFTDLQERTLTQCGLADTFKNTWEIPNDYFEQLTEKISVKVQEQKLKDMITESGFSTPDGYFENAQLRLLLRQKLMDQGANSGFTVPEGYFEEQYNRITDRVYDKQDTRIKKIGSRKWVGYAAAACIAFAIGVFGVTKMITEHNTPPSNHLVSVSDQEIFNYLELYGSDQDITYISEQLNEFDEPIIDAGISEEDIEAYLNHTL